MFGGNLSFPIRLTRWRAYNALQKPPILLRAPFYATARFWVVSLSIRDEYHQRMETNVPNRPADPEMWLAHDTRAIPSSSKRDLSLPRPWRV